ncbi:hypothetical protein [Flexivirga alba]|uniref:DUF559 domain-containing protein n=1 Tax=Flexivirga alba TaxID=702742 RepID=A0ABW2AGK0_9MICO
MSADAEMSRYVVEGRPLTSGADRRAIAVYLAADCGGVVHRLTLARHGIDRFGVRNEVAAGRWFKVGRHTVAVGSPELSPIALRWRAVWESGSGSRLDGVSALLAGGMTGFTSPVIDVSLPARNRHHRVEGVRLHLPRAPAPVATSGIPRVAVEVATIHAAQWAASHRQATLLICLPLQQRLTTPTRVELVWRGVERSTRHTFLSAVIGDVTNGAHSLGELDFARMARRAGLPEPTRQAVRQGPNGRVYLDVAWDDVGLVVEIDGGHHALALNPVDDALRQNDRVVAGENVIRIPVLGLRLKPTAFMRQVRRAYDRLCRC